ncbi:MAG: hypothetical protein WBQ66_06445 [Blastocatellia bacterium]|jgi:hypothetical protein
MKNEPFSGVASKALPNARKNQDRRDSAGESGGNAGAGRSGHEDLGSEKPQDDLGSNKPGKGAGGDRAVDDDPGR